MIARIRFPHTILAILVAATAFLAMAASAHATPVVVEVKDGVDPASVAQKAGVVPENTFNDVANGFSSDVSTAQLRKLQASTSVEAITFDSVIANTGRSAYTLEGGGGANADQPAQTVKVALKRVGVLLSPTADVDGRNDAPVDADIAILDGGVDKRHPDLNVRGGADCAPGKGWDDLDGHGTMVAGIAAALDNKIGIVGTAPGARIWSVRVADSNGDILDSSLLCGLEWVVDHSGKIEVANMSLAGDENFVGPCWTGKRPSGQVDRIHQRICRAQRKGVTLVAAAGNYAEDATTFTPATYDEVIAVSAFADFDGVPGGFAATPSACWPEEADDVFATFSNFGSPIDIAAPGVCVTSTFPNRQYAYADGTSLASPFVAGGAALLAANHPNWSPERIKQELLEDAEAGPIAGDPDAFAEGILNVAGY